MPPMHSAYSSVCSRRLRALSQHASGHPTNTSVQTPLAPDPGLTRRSNQRQRATLCQSSSPLAQLGAFQLWRDAAGASKPLQIGGGDQAARLPSCCGTAAVADDDRLGPRGAAAAPKSAGMALATPDWMEDLHRIACISIASDVTAPFVMRSTCGISASGTPESRQSETAAFVRDSCAASHVALPWLPGMSSHW